MISLRICFWNLRQILNGVFYLKWTWMEEERPGVLGIHRMPSPDSTQPNEHNPTNHEHNPRSQELPEQCLPPQPPPHVHRLLIIIIIRLPYIKQATTKPSPDPKARPAEQNDWTRAVPSHSRPLHPKAPLLPRRLIPASLRPHPLIPQKLTVHESTRDS